MQNVETSEHSWFDQATSDVNKYEGENGDEAYAYVEEEASQSDDASMQYVDN
jgi:hypothetical protein